MKAMIGPTHKSNLIALCLLWHMSSAFRSQVHISVDNMKRMPPIPPTSFTTTSTTTITTTETATTKVPTTVTEKTSTIGTTELEITSTEESSTSLQTEEPSTVTETPTTTTTGPTTQSTSSTTGRPWNLCPIDDPMQPPDTCPPREDIPTFFPYPYSCQKYFICSNGAAICQRCPNGTLWDQEHTICDREANVRCVVVTTTAVYHEEVGNGIIEFVKRFKLFSNF